jgi:glycosyltransferase involved in cell wall biosynthesis
LTDTVKVLVWGTAQEGPCAYFRGHMFDEPLKALGIEMRHISKVHFKLSKEWEGKDPNEALKAGGIELDTTDLEWADVVLFRRYYNTAMKCALPAPADWMVNGCGFLTQDPAEAAKHPHGVKPQDDITRAVWPAVRDGWSGSIIYETDDNHWQIKPWNGYYPDVVQERDLIADMTRRADLVTVATPALAAEYGRYNASIRVIRNAIDPDLYVKDTPHPGGDKPRFVYYGSTARMRDYMGYPDERGKWEGGFARRAIDANAHLIRRVFLGTNPGTEHIIEALFDEQHPYVEGISAFSKALANSHGDVGIAPLGGDDFDRCKSELHWLEYAMADMAFIGQRFKGEGPYQVVRDGVDGLLARGAQEWHDSVRKLATSPDLRADLAGRAKERVLAEYDYRLRAQEWADAIRWAAEHPGYGRRLQAA